jgi:hypothetical protein
MFDEDEKGVEVDAPEAEAEIEVVEEAGEDERLSADQRETEERDIFALPYSALTADEKRERRRSESKDKKERQKERRAEKDFIIDTLSTRLTKAEQIIEQLGGKIIQKEASEVEASYNHYVRRANEAKRLRDQAAAENDTNGALHYNDILREAVDKAGYYDDLRRKPLSPPQVANSISPTAQANVADFMSRHTYYKPGGQDEVSRIIDQIDARVSERYDPATPEYFEELEEQMAAHRRLNNLLADADEDAPPPRRTETRGAKEPGNGRAAPSRGGPPVGGRSEAPRTPSASGNKVTLPAAFVSALKEAGQWNDPALRNKAIKEFATVQKQLEAEKAGR